ncbi:uroporphyrinogen-III C-methyltransferase [Rhodanobacter sp. B2A1Ga4]|uniref:uroporphyrinogen-III C-methyltransferase n=1 Tax=Rhodanobacter TaxID=75309 RepID=UPI000D3873E9|nr:MULTISPECIES: uroporphyrinogen-III C-methyltransferase [Rhodanobacter]MBQ4854903.1 uroporphyrinogen-III C-methyltransferase [Rhodanobacter sp. B2A1Ga4]
MSNVDKPNAPEGVRPDPAAPDAVLVEPSVRATRSAAPRPAPRPRGGGSLALAVLLALVAVGASGYIGWRQWQQEQGSAADNQSVASLQQRVATLETTLTALGDQRSSLNQRLDDAAQVNRSLREELLGQAERTRHLEDAVAKLAEKSLSGRDGMLLDETESLLRMAGERYTLFHDAQGAAAAYALADKTLAAVNDGAFSGLRQSINAEHEALVKSQPASQAGALQQLVALRGELAGLPLKPLDSSTAEATDAWSRIRRALASVVSVQRDDGAPLAVADARFARELAALDLAQAQAALLAHDSKGYAAALQRVDTALTSQFDGSAPAVQQARETLKQLASQLPADAPVQLGAALSELRNLRAVHALSPAAAGSAASGGARP